MFVISIYGRAGQGVESAVEMLSKAASANQLSVQSIFFPSQERRGPPVFGQVKIDKLPIKSRQIESYDFALVLDRSLDVKAIIDSGKDGSSVIFNAQEKLVSNSMKNRKMKSYFVNASSIALSAAGKPMPNIAMLGAFVKLYAKMPVKSIRTIVENSRDQVTSLEEGYRSVK